MYNLISYYIEFNWLLKIIKNREEIFDLEFKSFGIATKWIVSNFRDPIWSTCRECIEQLLCSHPKPSINNHGMEPSYPKVTWVHQCTHLLQLDINWTEPNRTKPNQCAARHHTHNFQHFKNILFTLFIF